jgi:DNA-binding transcriptional ArsR family regulator
VLDRVYGALSDATRRRILTTLRAGEARITDLARDEPVSFAAIARHVGVLEEAGLVHREVRGRDHWLSLARSPLDDAEDWIRAHAAFWSVRVDALADRLAERPER